MVLTIYNNFLNSNESMFTSGIRTVDITWEKKKTQSALNRALPVTRRRHIYSVFQRELIFGCQAQTRPQVLLYTQSNQCFELNGCSNASEKNDNMVIFS